MLTYFPRYFSTRAIYCYVITLALVSVIFMNYALPFQYMLFGFVPVVIFFTYSTQVTRDWGKFSSKLFSKKVFNTALVIRVVYVIFIYFYFIEMTGLPHAYHPGDELFYHTMGTLLRDMGYKNYVEYLRYYADFSDRGYPVWITIVYTILGPHVLVDRIVKCVVDAYSCVLMYNLARRNFGEAVGRMTAVFCMLMPNMWYYCGITLKETVMVFLVILFVERADAALHAPQITFRNIILPGLVVLAMFAFRTALAAVMIAAFAGALILSSGKQLQTWKKILYVSVFAIWMFLTMGVEMIEETQQLWAGRTENQSVGYQSRAEHTTGNTLAKYASASVFAPFIFTIPFSSMVATPTQENQMMMNGANFIKNIMSGFTIFAVLSLLFSGEWRKHVLPLALTAGYLVVLVFSDFAHSERFHFPVLAMELMFAAYGVTQVTNRHKRWFMFWLMGMCFANIAWSWIKLAGRGMV